MKKHVSNVLKILIVNLVLMVFVISSASGAKNKITKAEIVRAQQEWAKGIVAIGKAYTDKKNYKKTAQNMINRLYAYQSTKVLFNPTKTADIQFRPTKEGALSYFIGENRKFPEDKGFALQPWVKVKVNNSGGIYIGTKIALAMGIYSFTPLKGNTVDVDFSFGYIKNKKGQVKIVMQHSSLPYTK